MEMPKFIQQMTDFLTQSNSRAYRPGILQSLPLFGSGTYEEDIKDMKEAARESEFFSSLDVILSWRLGPVMSCFL